MRQGPTLPLERCPQCGVAKPSLHRVAGFESTDDRDRNRRTWGIYQCRSCGGVSMAVSYFHTNGNQTMELDISQIWPTSDAVDEAVPQRAKAYLDQALACVHAPAGAVMLTASAVDAMLKEKGFKDGTLFNRIESAEKAHLITPEMAKWAHEVRLDANDQRHVDEGGALPDEADARKSIEFAIALAQFLFVLPARVARGRAK